MVDQKILHVLSKKIRISPNARVSSEQFVQIDNVMYEFDAIVENGKELIYVEIKNRLTNEGLSKFNLYKDVITKQSKEKTKFAMVVRKVGAQAETLAKVLGIILIEAPRSFFGEDFQVSRATRVRLSTTKSFNVIFKMIENGPSTIQELSEISATSYGWTQAVVRRLIDLRVAERKYGLYSLSNLDKLFDAVAYERPIGSLVSKEYWAGPENIMELARDFTLHGELGNIEVALMGPTALLAYDPYQVRSDEMYLYIDSSKVTAVKDEFSLDNNGTVKIVIFLPDRNVFANSQKVNGIRVTSKEQTLLDLISFGLLYRDSCRRMVDKVGLKQY